MSNNFDWDDIDAGNSDVNHSQKFFTKKHAKHEPCGIIVERNENKENLGNVDEDIACPNDQKYRPTPQNENISVDKNTKLNSSLKADNQASKPTALNQENLKDDTSTVNGHKSNNGKQDPLGPITNLVEGINISDNVKLKGSVYKLGKAAHIAPNACRYTHIYEERKTEQIRLREEEQKRLREFHSRPAPNFSVLHKKFDEAPRVHVVTVPHTPKVLKNSSEYKQRNQKKLELLTENRIPKFRSRSPSVLNKMPFQPKKSPVELQVEPFNLHMERRLEDRRKYDKQVQQKLEEKKQKEQEAQQRREEEMVKQLRSRTTFKARPNPFNRN